MRIHDHIDPHVMGEYEDEAYDTVEKPAIAIAFGDRSSDFCQRPRDIS